MYDNFKMTQEEHTQTICRQFRVFDHFVILALKGLSFMDVDFLLVVYGNH